MTSLNIREIMGMLPHRYPILLVDRVLECDDEKRIVAIKNVSANEPFFQGHFPGLPVMPGVLQIEALAQTGGLLLIRCIKKTNIIPFFLGIDKARFRRVVEPGDQLRMEVELTKSRSTSARFQGKITVDGEVACEATLLCMFREREDAE